MKRSNNGHIWTYRDWQPADLLFEETVKTCTICALQVQLKRRIEFEGYGARIAIAFRMPGEDWKKMYHGPGRFGRALPGCIIKHSEKITI